MNAIISAARKDMVDGTLYLAGFEGIEPINAISCTICRRLIKNAGIKRVVNIYGDVDINVVPE